MFINMNYTCKLSRIRNISGMATVCMVELCTEMDGVMYGFFNQKDKIMSFKNPEYCGTRWLIGGVDACRPEGCGFETHG